MTSPGSPDPVGPGSDDPDGVAVVEDGVVVEANAAYAAIHGTDGPGAITGREWTNLYGERATEALAEVEETGSWRGELHAVGDGDGTAAVVELTRTGETTFCVARPASGPWDRFEFYETVLTNAPDAIYTLDGDGRITWINEYVLEKYDVGYDREELVGEYVSVVLGPEDINRSLSVIRELVADESKDSGRCEVTVRTQDGEEIPVELHIALLPDPDGGIQGTIGIIREITERKRHEQRLSVLQRVLRHNVRNASSVILGYADQLKTAVPSEERHALDRIRRAATDLDELGEKARRVQRELDDGVPSARKVDLVATLEAVREAVTAEYPTATVEFDLPETATAGTGEAIHVAVQALVENAVEHNDGDDPRVRVTVEPPGERDDGRVAIRVDDDGPGIPDHERRVLTADTEEPLDHGSGLGLWLVQWFVAEYDGRLDFGESEWGGASVEITLPAAGE